MNDTAEFKDLCIDKQSKIYLKEIAMWGKFLAILGFIKFGFLILYTIVFPLISHKLEAYLNYDLPVIGITLFFLFMAVIVYFPSSFLYCFARCTKRALKQNDQDIMRHAFQSLKAYYRYVGILVIVMLCMYPVAIITAIIVY
ncbi:hypothetical protein L3073_08600 [Ancylomarina sp. DW003]|nr:hypothetical protein [Ancylomarina sp. DW003]MDE5422267.1 hypothetical protein [Ancylomarina sp. DW003]